MKMQFCNERYGKIEYIFALTDLLLKTWKLLK
jgi:hypothetical protein